MIKYLGGEFLSVGDFLEVNDNVYQIQLSKVMKNKVIFKRSSFVDYVQQCKSLRDKESKNE